MSAFRFRFPAVRSLSCTCVTWFSVLGLSMLRFRVLGFSLSQERISLNEEGFHVYVWMQESALGHDPYDQRAVYQPHPDQETSRARAVHRLNGLREKEENGEVEKKSANHKYARRQ